MTTGSLASGAGVNIQTVRYYERRGILRQPRRSRSGYRDYGADALSILRFVKRAQALGFTLREIEDLLRLRDGGRRTSCAKVRATALEKIEDIDRRLDGLRAMKRALGTLVRSCVDDGSARECPILEALDREDGGR